MEYKRNQFEEAISAVVEPKTKQRASQGLQVKLKRLLEADRAQKRSARASDPARQRYAFFSAEPPGRGVEVWFSEYEVFAGCLSLQLLSHGWTPEVAVSVMRRAREELESQHKRILQLFSSGRRSELDFDHSPVLVATTGTKPDGTEDALACSVRDSHLEAARWTWDRREEGQGFAMFHFAHYVQLINLALKKTEPRRRGQPG